MGFIQAKRLFFELLPMFSYPYPNEHLSEMREAWTWMMDGLLKHGSITQEQHDKWKPFEEGN